MGHATRICKFLLAGLLGLAATALGTTSASAQILYDNGAPTLTTYAEDADSGDPYGLTMAGTVFTPSASGNAYTLNFAGAYITNALPATDDFQVSLYTASGGSPGTLITTVSLLSSSVSRTLIGTSNMPGDPYFSPLSIYEFSGTLSTPLTLSTSSSYYLGVSDVGDGQDFGLTYTASPAASANEQSYYSGRVPNGYGFASGFNSFGDKLSFELIVPEPSEWGLGIMGLLALAVAAKRRGHLAAK